jgi:meso-butanediol dehydrogenase / (S,S)-butanediol dehydrogenase / diacetyl reductase
MRTVIVTGASSGIGEAVAKRFLDQGDNVVVCARDMVKLKKTFAKVHAKKILMLDTDVSKEADVKKMIDATVRKFKKIDVLVNNAGIYLNGDVDTSYKDWKNLMSINLDGVFLCSKAAMPYLKKSKGCIINTASVSGLGGDEDALAYNASKGGVVNMTKALAINHGRDGVRVNSICPSLTHTELTKDMIKDKKLVSEFKKRIPLNRYAEPEDVAGAYIFLASEDARFITGVNLPVDGGVGASNGQPIY